MLESRWGRRLGPVGSTIVAEALVWLMAGTVDTWINRSPGWNPTIVRTGEKLELGDVLEFAGMPMTFEDWKRRVRD